LNPILKIQLFAFFRQMLPVNSVLLPILLMNDLTASSFFTLAFVFRFIQLISEVPTAYLSDKYGRRGTLVISVFFLIAANSTLLLGNTFNYFIAYQVFLSFSNALMSGTDNTLMLDYGDEERYTEDYNTKMFCKKLGVVLGGLISTLVLFKFDYESLYWVQLLIGFIPLILIGSLSPVGKKGIEKEEEEKLSLIQVVSLIVKDKKAFSHILLLVMMGMNYFILFDFLQPITKNLGFDKSTFAFIITIVNLFLAFAIKKGVYITSKFKNENFAGLFYYYPAVIAFIIFESPWVLFLFSVPLVLRSVFFTSLSEMTKSANPQFRTVYESFLNLVASILLALFAKLSSYLITVFSIGTSLGICYSIILVLSIFAYMFYKRHHY